MELSYKNLMIRILPWIFSRLIAVKIKFLAILRLVKFKLTLQESKQKINASNFEIALWGQATIF